jgi:hypothetical protein
MARQGYVVAPSPVARQLEDFHFPTYLWFFYYGSMTLTGVTVDRAMLALAINGM